MTDSHALCAVDALMITYMPDIHAAVTDAVPAAIACPGGAVPACAGELQVGRAGHQAVPVKRTFGIIGTFKRHCAFVFQDPVAPDLLAYGRFVLSDRVGNGGLCGTIADPRLDHPALIKGESFVFV